MTQPLLTILALLTVLQVKHFLCDFPLQTDYQLANKEKYGHPGGILHSGIHVVGTLPVYLVLPAPVPLALAVMVGEFVAHYHIDWAKGQVMKATGWTVDDGPFWWALGFDQLLHQMTYVVIVGVLVVRAQA